MTHYSVREHSIAVVAETARTHPPRRDAAAAGIRAHVAGRGRPASQAVAKSIVRRAGGRLKRATKFRKEHTRFRSADLAMQLQLILSFKYIQSSEKWRRYMCMY